MFPEPPDAPDALVDVGKSCNYCGRNMGMYPVADICQYCRPKVQDNGDVIYGIAITRGRGDDEWSRIPNSYITLSDDGSVNIQKGRHDDAVLDTDAPKLGAGDANKFTVLDEEWTTYWVNFGWMGFDNFK